MTSNAAPTAGSDTRTTGVVAAAAAALLLGVFLVLGTGFSHSTGIHAAAHDSRHSFAFPCH